MYLREWFAILVISKLHQDSEIIGMGVKVLSLPLPALFCLGELHELFGTWLSHLSNEDDSPCHLAAVRPVRELCHQR